MAAETANEGDERAAASPAAPRAAFEWTAHPARERPWVALLVLVVIAVVPAWMVGLEESLAWSLFAALVLLFSLHRFFFVSYYAIADGGVTARTLIRKRHVGWAEVSGVQIGHQAVWISAARGPGWRERRRGVLILFGDRRDEVLARLRERVSTEIWNATPS